MKGAIQKFFFYPQSYLANWDIIHEKSECTHFTQLNTDPLLFWLVSQLRIHIQTRFEVVEIYYKDFSFWKNHNNGVPGRDFFEHTLCVLYREKPLWKNIVRASYFQYV